MHRLQRRTYMEDLSRGPTCYASSTSIVPETRTWPNWPRKPRLSLSYCPRITMAWTETTCRLKVHWCLERSACCRRRGLRRPWLGTLRSSSLTRAAPMYVVQYVQCHYSLLTCAVVPKSTKAALAYYAYALRRPSDCLEHLSQVQDISDAQGFASNSGTMHSAPATLQVPGTGSDTSLSSSWTGSFVSAQSSASIADIAEGGAWSAIERIRSICIKGG